MTFSYVDLETLSEEDFEYLKSINKWLDDDILTQVYVVKDNDDIKSVFCLKQRNRYVGAEICFGTKESERNKEYCSFGFNRILQVIKTEPQLEEVFLISVDTENKIPTSSNKVTNKLCEKAKIPAVLENIYCFSNPNFNPKYKELETMIKNETSLEELVEFCEDDEVMLKILNLWLKKFEKSKPKRFCR